MRQVGLFSVHMLWPILLPRAALIYRACLHLSRRCTSSSILPTRPHSAVFHRQHTRQLQKAHHRKPHLPAGPAPPPPSVLAQHLEHRFRNQKYINTSSHHTHPPAGPAPPPPSCASPRSAASPWRGGPGRRPKSAQAGQHTNSHRRHLQHGRTKGQAHAPAARRQVACRHLRLSRERQLLQEATNKPAAAAAAGQAPITAHLGEADLVLQSHVEVVHRPAGR